MKQTIFLICTLVYCFICTFVFAQAPQKMSYQAVTRNASNALVANQNVGMRISILQGSSVGASIYTETQSTTTNANGLASIEIGGGTLVSGNFSTINWASGSYFIKTETDPLGGTNYTITSTNQLLSIPYALYAQKSGNGLPDGAINGNTMTWNGTQWVISNTLYSQNGKVGIGISSPQTQLHTTGTVRHQSLAGNGNSPVYVDSLGQLTTFRNGSGANTIPQAIPDNSCTGITSTITMSGSVGIIPASGLSVTFNITHPYVGDLRIFLLDQFGNSINLVNGAGGSGDNFTNTTFSDFGSATIPASLASAPFTGTFKPMGITPTVCGMFPTFATFGIIGGGYINASGTWTLKVIDQAAGDVGTLNSWSMSISNVQLGTNNYLPKWNNNELTATSMLYEDGGKVGIGTTTPQAALHTIGTVRHDDLAGDGIRAMFADANGNLMANKNYVATSTVSGAIPDNSCGGITRIINVSNFPTNCPTKSIELTVNLTHTSLKELWMFLTAPNGQTLLLMRSDPFYPSTNFTNLKFSDNGLYPINSYASSTNVIFFPPQSTNTQCGVIPNVTTFEGFGNGSINPNGNWSLKIFDPTSGNSGTLQNWSISISNLDFFPENSVPKMVKGNLVAGDIINDTDRVIINTDIKVTGYLETEGKCSINGGPSNAALVVGGGNSTSVSGSRVYFNNGGGTSLYNANSGSSGGICIMAYGSVCASGGSFIATSDQRIKSKIGLTNTQSDLDVLNKIQVTDYTYIDKVANTNKPQKRAIAQQVKSIFPNTVNEEKDIISNVYEVAKSIHHEGINTIIETSKAHDFTTGDTIKLIVENGGVKYVKVSVIDKHTFSVEESIRHNVFVYGKQVDDLLNVDYDALAMLNISATQELSKQLKTLQVENEQLKQLCNNYLSAQASTNDKIKSLEAKLNVILSQAETAKK